MDSASVSLKREGSELGRGDSCHICYLSPLITVVTRDMNANLLMSFPSLFGYVYKNY